MIVNSMCLTKFCKKKKKKGGGGRRKKKREEFLKRLEAS